MNMSLILSRIKSTLGLYAFSLPFENVDDVLTEVITNITIPVFSIYCPLREKFATDLRDLECLEKHGNYETYLLPEWKTKQIIMVEDVNYDESLLNGIGNWGGVIPVATTNISSQIMLANASSQLSRHMIPKLTFEYMHPRKVRLFNVYTSCKMIFDLCCQHHPSLASIPQSASESFYQLALLDVKMMLYNTMKHYNEMETAYGRVNLKIDDWSNAEQERADLLGRWDDSYHMDLTNFYYA